MGSQWAIIPGERGFDEVCVPPCRRHRPKGFRHCSEITRWTALYTWKESGGEGGEKKWNNGEYDNRNKEGAGWLQVNSKAQKKRIEKTFFFSFSWYTFSILCLNFPPTLEETIEPWPAPSPSSFSTTSPWIILYFSAVVIDSAHQKNRRSFWCIDFAIPSQPVANNNQTVSSVATFILFFFSPSLICRPCFRGFIRIRPFILALFFYNMQPNGAVLLWCVESGLPVKRIAETAKRANCAGRFTSLCRQCRKRPPRPTAYLSFEEILLQFVHKNYRRYSAERSSV